MKALIVGYGRAGRRHKRLAEELGLTVKTADPYVPGADYDSLVQAMKNEDFPIVVIATPPGQHLAGTVFALDNGAAVLVEKPLDDISHTWDWAQLIESHPHSERVMVAYNYRYHPLLNPAQLKNSIIPVWLALNCYQHRPDLPAWGLLLDHVAHDVDILNTYMLRTCRWANLDVKSAFHDENNCYARVVIVGVANHQIPFTIVEFVDKVNPHVLRTAVLNTSEGQIQITADPQMFVNMWQDFIATVVEGHSIPTYNSLADAYQTQLTLGAILEQVRVYNGY